MPNREVLSGAACRAGHGRGQATRRGVRGGPRARGLRRRDSPPYIGRGGKTNRGPRERARAPCSGGPGRLAQPRRHDGDGARGGGAAWAPRLPREQRGGVSPPPWTLTSRCGRSEGGEPHRAILGTKAAATLLRRSAAVTSSTSSASARSRRGSIDPRTASARPGSSSSPRAWLARSRRHPGHAVAPGTVALPGEPPDHRPPSPRGIPSAAGPTRRTSRGRCLPRPHALRDWTVHRRRRWPATRVTASTADLDLAFERLIGGADGVHAKLAEWVALTEGPLLDLGCSIGITTVAYGQRHAPTLGLDRDREALMRARLRAKEHGSDVPFVCAAAERLPLPNARFGCVVAGESLQYVDDRGGVLREVARVLSAGGQFLLSVRAAAPTRRCTSTTGVGLCTLAQPGIA